MKPFTAEELIAVLSIPLTGGKIGTRNDGDDQWVRGRSGKVPGTFTIQYTPMESSLGVVNDKDKID